jgi:hypothetical protein
MKALERWIWFVIASFINWKTTDSDIKSNKYSLKRNRMLKKRFPNVC